MSSFSNSSFTVQISMSVNKRATLVIRSRNVIIRRAHTNVFVPKDTQTMDGRVLVSGVLYNNIFRIVQLTLTFYLIFLL